MQWWPSWAPAQELLSFSCAAFNATYFLNYLWRQRQDPAAPRLAAAALAWLFLALALQSLVFLGLMRLWPEVSPFDTLIWSLVRLLLLAGVIFVSLLVLRRLLSTRV